MDTRTKEGPYTQRLLVRSDGLFDGSPLWNEERVLWTALLLSLAQALDKRYGGGEVSARRRSTRVLAFAFETFLVLVDLEWWLANPPRDLSEDEEQEVSELRERRKQMIAELPGDSWAILTDLIHEGAEAFIRAGYREGLADCRRLLNLMLEPDVPLGLEGPKPLVN